MTAGFYGKNMFSFVRNCQSVTFKFKKFIYLFILALLSLLLCGLFSSCRGWGLLSGCGTWTSRCCGVSCGARALCMLASAGSVVVGSGAWAQ